MQLGSDLLQNFILSSPYSQDDRVPPEIGEYGSNRSAFVRDYLNALRDGFHATVDAPWRSVVCTEL